MKANRWLVWMETAKQRTKLVMFLIVSECIFSSIEIQRKKFFAWLHYCSQAQANIAFESQRYT
jgi:hypothetical protein